MQYGSTPEWRNRESVMRLNPITKTQVALVAPEETRKLFPLIGALAKANNSELVQWNACSPGSLSGVVIIKSPQCRDPLPVFPPNLSSFLLELCKPAETMSSVKLTSSQSFFPLLRGRRFRAADVAPATRSLAEGNVLAEINGRPVWTTCEENGARHDINLQANPWIAEEDRMFEHLNGQHLMRLLPLIEWFRSISDWAQWRKPPTRACFMFDDPNLHYRRYGFISFPHLADEGRRHRYHTAFATVPLDQYYINKPTARLFRENPGQLSLLVHGIGHTKRELAGDDPSVQQLMHLRRGINWIESLERRGGVRVSRVMAPPHGAFAAKSLRNCAIAGFEAACVSWGSVWSSNQDEKWSRLLGAEPATVVGGLPVIPRFRMAKETENQILLAAYLNQPIIAVGHQIDLADGIDLLNCLARFINQMGDVSWQGMEEIARSNYWWRQEGDILSIRPFSKTFVLHVPDGIRLVKIIQPFPTRINVSASRSAALGSEAKLCENLGDGSCALPIEGAPVLSINMEIDTCDATETGLSHYLPLKALVRRVLTESRDRVMPTLRHRWRKR